MRKFLSALGLAAAVLASVPASAQPYGGLRTGAGIEREIGQLDFQIGRAAANRAISPRQAMMLRGEAAGLQRQLAFDRRGGLDGREVAQLQFRLDRIHQQLRFERRG